MSRLRFIMTICAIGTVLLIVGWAGPQAERGQEARAGQFTGELMLVYAGSSKSGASLTNVRTESVGPRHFIVGTAIDPTVRGDWRAGAVVWVPIDDVTQGVEFPTIQAYLDAIENFEGFGEM